MDSIYDSKLVSLFIEVIAEEFFSFNFFYGACSSTLVSFLIAVRRDLQENVCVCAWVCWTCEVHLDLEFGWVIIHTGVFAGLELVGMRATAGGRDC